MLTFIIPVRHQQNSKDWSLLKRNLAATIRSVKAQTSNNWRGVIVANHGADLPDLPEGFEVNWVDFPPNPTHERGEVPLEVFYSAVRADKGRRILAGLLSARPDGHVMLLDDDDLVSKRLATYVSENSTANGWRFFQGYVWPTDGKLLYKYDAFHKFCGSSHIVRSDLLNIPASSSEATPEYISRTLGSHINIDDDLTASGTKLSDLPFIGSIYRVAHAGAHSKSKGILRQFFLNRTLLQHPLQTLLSVSRLKLLNDALRGEFFG